jgi:hypothetical protein
MAGYPRWAADDVSRFLYNGYGVDTIGPLLGDTPDAGGEGGTALAADAAGLRRAIEGALQRAPQAIGPTVRHLQSMA